MDKKNTIITVIGTIAIIVIAIIVAITINNKNKDMQKGSLNFNSGITQEILNEQADKTRFIVMVNTNIVVSDGEANLMIENPEENSNKCLVDIYDENDRLIYQSDIIPPGYYIEKAKLFEHMDSGEHTGKAVFNILNDNSETKSTATVKINLTVS